jgi:hypothetical protein
MLHTLWSVILSLNGHELKFRVARLGEFSHFGRLFSLFYTLNATEVARNWTFCIYWFGKTISCDTFWAFFPQTHLVTLLTLSKAINFLLLSSKCCYGVSSSSYLDHTKATEIKNNIGRNNHNRKISSLIRCLNPGANPTTVSYNAVTLWKTL